MSKVHLSPPNQITGTGLRIDETSLTFVKEKLVRTGRGVMHKLLVRNKNGTKMYVHVYDGVDSSGTLIVPSWPIAATDGAVDLDFKYGVPFTTGLYVSLSSTDATHTLIGTADGQFFVGYAVDASTPTSDA